MNRAIGRWLKAGALMFIAVLVMAACEGPAGVAGAKGDAGVSGQDGAAGPSGQDGAAGPQGLAGQDGAAGPQGPAGQDGATAGGPLREIQTTSMQPLTLKVANEGQPTTYTWDMKDYYVGGSNVQYEVHIPTGKTRAEVVKGLTVELNGSMVTLTLDPVATAKYGTKSVTIKVSDSTDAYVKDLMMRHNRAPLSGGAASPVVVPLGTQGTTSATKTATIKKGAHTVGETIDPNVHFVDDDTLTYDAVPAEVADRYKLLLAPVATGVKITGVQSTWDSVNQVHVPVDVSIGATDSGKLKVLDRNGEEVRVSTMITVDQAPSPRGAIPTTIIYDDGALAQASSDWWRFFKEPEGGFAASATWAEDLVVTGNSYTVGDNAVAVDRDRATSCQRRPRNSRSQQVFPSCMVESSRDSNPAWQPR